ncbi:MAG TPA: flavin reductase [Streptosporangiaceae bacterium]|nr:flavin reductase [Streptosporangiaceae bacterium]
MSDSFAEIVASTDPALIIVTAAAGGERAGCLVEFHSQSSMAPPRYCVWLSKANYTYRVALHTTHLAIHFLTSADLPLAELFGTQTGDEVDKFAGLSVGSGAGRTPVIERCRNRMVVRRTALLDEGGDHVCMVTEPVDVSSGGPFQPLRISHAPHLVAGHDPGERPNPPTERAAPGGGAGR